MNQYKEIDIDCFNKYFTPTGFARDDNEDYI